jgi:hypothetical protein
MPSPQYARNKPKEGQESVRHASAVGHVQMPTLLGTNALAWWKSISLYRGNVSRKNALANLREAIAVVLNYRREES